MRLNIPECPGFEASDDGNIYKAGSDKPKKQRPAANGAMQVHIGSTTRMVHDLVARTFHGTPPQGFRVKHLNEDLSDNRADNLAWAGSPTANARQKPTTPPEIERELERIERERYELIELMQT